jgi:hypothetical protein
MDRLSNKVLALSEQSVRVNLLNTTDDDFPSSILRSASFAFISYQSYSLYPQIFINFAANQAR